MTISLEGADLVFKVSSVVGVLFGLLAALSGGISYWSTTIRDQYAENRTQLLERRASEANSIAASASDRAAELEKRSEALKLELKARTQSLVVRKLSQEQISAIKDGLTNKHMRVTVMDTSESEEVRSYANSIKETLRQSGVEISSSSGSMKLGGENVVPAGLSIKRSDDADTTRLIRAFSRANVGFSSFDLPHGIAMQGAVIGVGLPAPLKE